MKRLFARPETGRAHRTGTQSLAPVGSGRMPLVIPDPVPVSRWQLPTLIALLSIAGIAMIAHRVVTLGEIPTPPRWTTQTAPVALSLAGHDMSVPANMISNFDQRSGGVQERLDLTVRWPTLAGYDSTSAALFEKGDRSLIRIWMEKGSTAVTNAGNAALGDAGRQAAGAADGRQTDAGLAGDETLRPEIYPVAGGLVARAFAPSSAHASEEIVYEAASLRSADETPYAARCQKWDIREATCLRRIPVAHGLTLTYRFPRERLADWGRLDRSVTDLAKGFLVKQHTAREDRR